MSADMTLLARQPIFNRDMEVFAYELLYRQEGSNSADCCDGDSASSQVLLNAFTELSIDEVVDEHKAFINFTSQLLSTEFPFDNQRLVIEVLESQPINQALLDNLSRLRNEGYFIALDDFELSEETATLIPYADIIKLDVQALNMDQLKFHAESLGDSACLLAEKIETHEQLEQCKNLGFQLFQGYFLSRPNLIKGSRNDVNRQTIIRLLANINNSNASFNEIEQLISNDPLLSYKLLRLINSATFRFVKKVDSLQQAITLLGLNQIKGWASLIALTQLDDKPKELVTIALTRAKLCHSLAESLGEKSVSDSCFTAGMLSTIDAFLDQPLEKILNDIPLSEDLKKALLYHEGLQGLILQTAKYFERGQWHKINWEKLQSLGIHEQSQEISKQLVATEYRNALTWVKSVQSFQNS